MQQDLTKLYEGNDLAVSKERVLYLPIMRASTLLTVKVKTDEPQVGDAVFAVLLNNAEIEEAAVTIADGAKIGAVAGLDIELAEGDEFVLNLISGNVSAPITLNLTVDDGAVEIDETFIEDVIDDYLEAPTGEGASLAIVGDNLQISTEIKDSNLLDKVFALLEEGDNITLVKSGGKIIVTGESGGSGEANTGSNVGSGSNVFKAKTGVDLAFRKINAGTNVTVTENTNDITIAAAGGGASELGDLSDVEVNTPLETGHILICDSDSIFKNGVQGEMFTINVQGLTYSPVDAQTTYFGTLPKAPLTTAGASKIYIRRKCILRMAEIYNYSGTAGSGEGWSLYVRKNGSVDYLISTVSAATSERVFSNTALNSGDGIALVPGDYIEIKAVNPTWGTNPLTSIWGGVLYFFRDQKIYVAPTSFPTLAHCIGRHEAKDMTGIADNARSQYWNDTSGNNNHLNQPTAGVRPYKRNNVINGLAAFDFTPSYSTFNFATGIFSGLSQCEIFIVARCDADPPSDTSNALISLGGSSASCHYPYVDGTVYQDFGSTTRYSFNPAPDLSKWHCVNFLSKNNYWSCKINGSLVYEEAVSNTVSFTNQIVQFLGLVTAVFVLSQEATSGERSGLLAYIESNYGVSMS